jgi:hypothetical protein
MSAQDRYTKIIESLVNGEEATASELLHEAFVERAREIWSDLVEQDDIVEDDISEEELEEAIGDEEAGDFIDGIETDEDEIEAEEAFGEADDEEAEMELAGGDDMEMEPEMDMDMEGGDDGVEAEIANVEDALASLKAEFAKIMGDDEPESDDMEPEMDMDMDMDDEEEETEESFAFESDESEEELDEEVEELEEAADLHKIGKENAIHPKEMPAGDDGKASPTAGKNDMGGETIKTGAKASAGSAKGLSDATAKDMGVTHPGDGAKLSAETRGHGAEKKGSAE